MVKKHHSDPRDQIPKKVCARGISCNTNSQLIIDALKEYDFIEE